MIEEDKLILRWQEIMFRWGVLGADTNVYMALRHAIREYNKVEEVKLQELAKG